MPFPVLLAQLLSLLGSVSLAAANIINVPDEINGIHTIQDGIDAAIFPGDEVVVADGMWAGEGNVNLDFGGRVITVRSANGPENCIIDGGLTHHGFVFDNGEGPGSVVSGFTIQDCDGGDGPGGAIKVLLSSPTITGCIVRDSSATRGGGIYVLNGGLQLSDSFITCCDAGVGGGICIDSSSSVAITGCLISCNQATFEGGGVQAQFSTVVISDCTMVDNRVTDATSFGGGLRVYYGDSTTIMHCTFNNNTAQFGGGVASAGDHGVTLIADSTFKGNSATCKGGGAAVEGACNTITVTGSTFTSNTAGLDGGGFFDATTDSVTTFTNNALGKCMAARGGGAFLSGNTTMRDNCFYDNAAQFGAGVMFYLGVHLVAGGLYTGNVASVYGGAMIMESAIVLLDACLFAANSAGVGGGACAASTNAVVRFLKCLFDGNESLDGGGLALFGLTGDEAGPGEGTWMVNCTLRDNVATRWGGAVHNNASAFPIVGCLFAGNAAQRGGAIYNLSSDPTLVNCTVTANVATVEGGGLFNTTGSGPELVGCILWGDSPDEMVTASGAPSVRHSTMQGGVPAGGDDGGNIDVDPRFVDAAGADWRLQDASPCLDAGDNSAVPAEVTTDLAGSARFVDSPDAPDCPQSPGACGEAPVVDMGAFERSCPPDLDGSGAVDFGDLLVVLSNWGAADVPADLDGSGVVDFGDLLIVLSSWGTC